MKIRSWTQVVKGMKKGSEVVEQAKTQRVVMPGGGGGGGGGGEEEVPMLN
jgi:hypothetical protein